MPRHYSLHPVYRIPVYQGIYIPVYQGNYKYRKSPQAVYVQRIKFVKTELSKLIAHVILT